MGNIENLLQLWGAWARGGIDGKIKPLAMYNDGSASPSRDCMNDEDAAIFDPAVATLKQFDKELYEVVRLHYIYRLSFNAIAKIKHASRIKIQQQNANASVFIAGYLCAIDTPINLKVLRATPF